MPRSTIDHYRKILKDSGTMVCPGVWSLADKALCPDAMLASLETMGGDLEGGDLGNGRAASFVFRWYCQGGRMRSEIYPIALEWVEATASPDWFIHPSSLPPGAAVIDHEAFLAWVASSTVASPAVASSPASVAASTTSKSAKAIILDAEQIEEAAAEASGEKESIDCPQPELSALAWRFVSDRTVSLRTAGLCHFLRSFGVRSSVDCPSRHALILINAAAGTGKTHVLARRLLVLQGVEHVDGDKILVLSFSRAGAGAGPFSRFFRDVPEQFFEEI
ncbi:MAG TPA: UvrD-helicase domain-containing protein [Firmicutes bacterium]|nr:UvrD-helicase domain-containing protein [Bacillota bacterium]